MRANARRRIAVAILAASLPALAAAPAEAETQTTCSQAFTAPRQVTMHFMRSSILCLVNRARKHRGLPLLRYNPDLRVSATAHSDDMVENGYFSHYGPHGSTPYGRVARTGYMASARDGQVGENLGWGTGARTGSPAAIFRAWIHSPEHRANIFDPAYRDFGSGVSRGSPRRRGRASATYTLDFGSRH